MGDGGMASTGRRGIAKRRHRSGHADGRQRAHCARHRAADSHRSRVSSVSTYETDWRVTPRVSIVIFALLPNASLSVCRAAARRTLHDGRSGLRFVMIASRRIRTNGCAKLRRWSFPNSRSSRACGRSTSGLDRNISHCRSSVIRRKKAVASPGVCLPTTQSTIFCAIRSMPAPMLSAKPAAA